MGKINIGMIFGGEVADQEISRLFAKNILKSIKLSKYEVVLIKAETTGAWRIVESTKSLSEKVNLSKVSCKDFDMKVAIIPGEGTIILVDDRNLERSFHLDVVIPIVHGSDSRGGALQGLLQIINLPFVGCDILSTAICMDRIKSKCLLRDAGVPVVPFLTYHRQFPIPIFFKIAEDLLGLPLIVKPSNQGSSVGGSVVKDENDFLNAIDLASEYDNDILIEAFTNCREIKCVIIGNEYPSVIECGEIEKNLDHHNQGFECFDTNESGVLIPATLSNKDLSKIISLAVEAYQVLGMLRHGERTCISLPGWKILYK